MYTSTASVCAAAEEEAIQSCPVLLTFSAKTQVKAVEK